MHALFVAVLVASCPFVDRSLMIEKDKVEAPFAGCTCCCRLVALHRADFAHIPSKHLQHTLIEQSGPELEPEPELLVPAAY